MIRKVFLFILSLSWISLFASTPKLPKEVRGFCIAMPSYDGVNFFVDFIEKELVPRKINVLIMRVDYNYRYTSHPELISNARRKEDSSSLAALTKEEIKRIVSVCSKNNIILVPQVNLFGHQSWAGQINPLLKVYPQFDETPWVNMPSDYKWPNDDGLYCKSYCPLHPEVHDIVFDLVDEIMEVCETRHFHAGMDEVFYIGMDKCVRCAGKDKSKLFADEVNKINHHVKSNQGRLWIWGDRMIDGVATELGMWEGSTNDTYRSIDMIDRDVVINDWHYESSPKTAETFASKGFDVMMCPWRRAEIAKQQVRDYKNFKEKADRKISINYRGFIQTVWTSAENFLGYLNGTKTEPKYSTAECFKTLFEILVP